MGHVAERLDGTFPGIALPVPLSHDPQSRWEDIKGEVLREQERYDRLAAKNEALLSELRDLLRALRGHGLTKLRTNVAMAANAVYECISRSYTPLEMAALLPTPDERTREVMREAGE